MPTILLDFRDLKARKIADSREQLSQLQERYDFPAGFKLGANSRRWTEEEVEAWIVRRRKLSAPGGGGAPAIAEVPEMLGHKGGPATNDDNPPQRPRPRGRPRKVRPAEAGETR